jgi:dTMP kinase
MLIAFEGGEGAGKSTQARLLADRLRALGRDVVETREPGGTPGAEAIRDLFVNGPPERWTARTDALLIAAARAEHVARLIRPALAAGRMVLCDRFVHSTLAYQGHGHGLDIGALTDLHRFASDSLWPDRVVWIDLPAEEGLRRAAARGAGPDRFEAHALAFHERIREGFRALAKADPRIRRIDGLAPVEAVADAIWAELAPLLEV